MLRHTGAAKVSIDAKFHGQGMLKALLYNFDVDGDAVKQEHRVFLETKVYPLLAGDSGHIWMQGSASKSGGDVHNMQLSKRRVAHIAGILRASGILDRQMQLDAVGEQDAQTHPNEDETDRAVALIVLPMAKNSPPPPRKIPPPPRVTTDFKVRLLGALAASAGPFQMETCFFQIADTKNQLTAFYTYRSGGAGKGVIPRMPLSATMKGPWNSFTTNVPIRVSQFEGPTRFTTAGAGNWTINYLNMMGLPKGASTVPSVLSITTGFTVGIGASTSAGVLTLVPREEMIYGGD